MRKILRQKANVCSVVPAHGQPIGGALFLHFGSAGTADLAVMSALGDDCTLVSLLCPELLGAFLCRAFAVGGSLLAADFSWSGRLAVVSF